MGPKLVAIRVFYEANKAFSATPPTRIFPLDNFSTDQLMSDQSDPLSTQLYNVLENERRLLDSRIQTAVSNRIRAGGFPTQVYEVLEINGVRLPPPSPTSPAGSTGSIGSVQAPDPQPTDPVSVPPKWIPRKECPRYEAIGNSLKRRRVGRDLALDTMNFVFQNTRC